ncbi:MAG TPA: sugar ABC transporter ATP-binding protein, partial [Firmicutes bacterium]|nr:sugar ABC transporter ATP-binding protein [Bacillota bacterium]
MSITVQEHNQSAPPVVQLTNLVKRYGLNKALNGVDLTIEGGKVVGLLG